MTDHVAPPARPEPPTAQRPDPLSDRPGGPPVRVARAGRPVLVKVAAILAFVQAGFSIVGAFYAFGGADELSAYGLLARRVGSTLTTLGIAAFVVAAALIIGGLGALKGRGLLLVLGSGLSIALSVWWAVEFDYVSKLRLMAVMMAVLPVVALSMALSTAPRAWLSFDVPGRPVAATSPSVSTGVGGAAGAGWQPDPAGRHQLRFWDGASWTAHVADDGVAAQDQL